MLSQLMALMEALGPQPFNPLDPTSYSLRPITVYVTVEIRIQTTRRFRLQVLGPVVTKG